MNALKNPTVLALLAVAYVLGTAYGKKTPVVSTVAGKLPGASV